MLRKAMGKKIASLIRDELRQFIVRAVERGVEKKTAESLAEQIETFGRYGFNLSHSAAYSLIAYHTAWLKAHYPAEFMAAMLSAVVSSTDDVVKYIGECRELPRYLPKLDDGIQVLAPDVNESGWKFTAVGETHIRFGLGAIRGVGSTAVKSILKAREADGSFTAMFEFLERVDLRALNKRAVEALITAGALDSFGYRSQLLAGLDTAYSEISARKAEEAAGQVSLFGSGDEDLERKDPGLPNVPRWPEPERLKREKEALGFFISGHPLDQFAEVVRAFDHANTANLKDNLGRPLDLACVVTKVTRQISRRDNSEWGKITIEDFHGTATVLAFKDTWQKHKETLQQDAVVLISGKVSGRERDEEDPPIFLDDALLLEGIPNSGQLALQIELPMGAELDDDVFSRAKEVLVAHPGTAPVELRLGSDNGIAAPVLRSRTLKADASRDTIEALQEMFGKARVRLVRVGEGKIGPV
ncbi:MAG TPA: hypothetical protein EYQ64_00450 [Gemmatimonadetes bacterium]|nr:hypothetical protein [Gemmatimonadota bacterium]